MSEKGKQRESDHQNFDSAYDNSDGAILVTTWNWLWAISCHPFGPFSNTSHVSQMLKDVTLVNAISLWQSYFYYWQVSWLVSFICKGTQYMHGFCTLSKLWYIRGEQLRHPIEYHVHLKVSYLIL